MIIDADGVPHFFSEEDKAIHSKYYSDSKLEFDSKNGLKFQFDLDRRSIITDDPNIFIYMHSDMWNGSMKSAFIFHYFRKSISFGGPGGGYFDSIGAKDDSEGNSYWKIESIGADLKYIDRSKARARIPLSNSSCFVDRRHQDVSTTLLGDALTHLAGDIRSLAKRHPQTAYVVWDDVLSEKLKNGSLIEG